MMTLIVKITAVNFILLLVISHAYGWGPIAHFSINRESGYDPVTTCMNLPDAWPNTEWVILVSEWFSWSHGVRTTGGFPVPNTPSYPDDGRYPGNDMYQIVMLKKKEPGPNAVETAYAFIGHNAMDRVVHYSYFLGGSTVNWLVHHARKEDWADYVVYLDPMHGDGDFDEHGRPATFFGITIDLNNRNQILIPCIGNAEVIQIAQKVYRKNRRFTKSDNSGSPSETDTIAAINDRINNFQRSINDKVRQLNLAEFLALVDDAEIYNWSDLDVENLYQRALKSVKESCLGAGN